MDSTWQKLYDYSKKYQISKLQEGDLLKLQSDVLSIIYHYGIVIDENGKKFVYHNTPDLLNRSGGSIVREPIEKWLFGKDIISIEPTGLTSAQINEIVKEVKSERYDALNFNCEHFTNYIRSRRMFSPQVAKWALAVAAVSISILLFYNGRKS